MNFLMSRFSGFFTPINSKTIYQNRPPAKGKFDTVDNINNSLDSWSADMDNQTYYLGTVITGIVHPVLGGSTWSLFGNKLNNGHEWQILITYSTSGIVVLTRCKTGGNWQNWSKK